MSPRERVEKILRWSEKYTKTDMLYLAKGGFWLTASKVIGISASFATSIAFANLLPEHTYGVYRYVLSLMTMLVIPTLPGIDTALTRAVARGHDSSFFPALKTKSKWGLLGSVASILLAGYYFFNANTELGTAFLLAAAFIPVMDPANLFLAYLSGKKNFKSQMHYQSVIRAVSSLAIIGLVFITDNILALLLVYFTSYTLLRLIFLFKIKRQVNRSTPTDPETVSYGKHLTAMKIPGIISAQLDKILIFHYIGGGALAGYYLALLPFKQMQNILGSVNVLALPNFSQTNTATIKKTLPKKILKSYLVIVPIVFIYIVLAHPFFTIFYNQYVTFVFISQLFMIQLLFFPIGLMHTALTALADKKKLYLHSTSMPIIRIILVSILVPLYGITGAVASVLATTTLSALFSIYLFAKLK